MQEPIIKKKPKQEPSPFSKNIQAYIFANNLNRQDFADLINAYMAVYPDRGKIYSNNDVWTYERRGSLPKDMRALVAIAKIMGKPLEEVLTTVIPAEQFAPPRLPQPPLSGAATTFANRSPHLRKSANGLPFPRYARTSRAAGCGGILQEPPRLEH